MSISNLNVSFCMVCEDVRPEMHGKYSILGFFGLLPHVNIKLKEMGKALARLVFLINVEGDPGKYKFKFSVIGPNKDKVVPDIALGEMEIMDDLTKRSMAVVNLAGLVFEKEGSYKVQMSLKNKIFYESTFKVAQGSPELF